MIGRKEERAYIQRALDSTRPEFIALYGRRRVGKTYLIKEFFNDSFSFYSTGVQNCNTRQQLKIFREALVKYGDEDKTIRIPSGSRRRFAAYYRKNNNRYS